MQQNFPSAIPTFTVGGVVFTDLENLITLFGSMAGAANGNSSLRIGNGTAGYQIPVGKTLYVRAIEWDVLTVATTGFTVGYADNDVSIESNTGFTNQVGPAGSPGAAAKFGGNTVGIYSRSIFFTIPAGKYAICTNAGGALSAGLKMYGYLR